MWDVRVLGLLGLGVTTACSFSVGSGRSQPPPPPPQPQPQAQPQPAQPTRPGVGMRMGRVGGATNNPPGTAQQVRPGSAAPPPSEPPVNAAKVQDLMKRSPKACGFAEVSPANWVRVDCHAYSPSARAISHLSPRKQAFVNSHQAQWQDWRSVASGLTQKFGTRSLMPGVGGKPGEGAPVAAGGPMAVKADSFPAAVDHRTAGLEGPIKDQGRVGACTAFSLSSVVDNQAIRAQKQTANNFDQASSPIHVWGGYGVPQMGTAADSSANRTIATNATWVGQSDRDACKFANPAFEECGALFDPPFVPGTWKSDPAMAAKWEKANAAGAYKIGAIEKLAVQPPNMEELIGVLASGSDLWIAMKIDGYAWSNSKMSNGVIADWSNPTGGHAVVMSGYRDTPSGKQFLIHNSWGTSWGEQGYAWVSENMVKTQMHYAYKVALGDGVLPAAPTDHDCKPEELMDLLQGKCNIICPDGSRPQNGCGGGGGGGGAAPAPSGGIPGLPAGIPTTLPSGMPPLPSGLPQFPAPPK